MKTVNLHIRGRWGPNNARMCSCGPFPLNMNSLSHSGLAGSSGSSPTTADDAVGCDNVMNQGAAGKSVPKPKPHVESPSTLQVGDSDLDTPQLVRTMAPDAERVPAPGAIL